MYRFIAILLTIQLSASDQIPYKDYCGECFTMVIIEGDTFAVDGTWKPIPEIADLNIKPSTTIYLEPEKFIPKYHTPFVEVKQDTDWNKVIDWLFNIPLLIFSTLYFFLIKKF
jgi:hypothetical protein